MDRLQQLLSFIEQEPDDPFNQYALALEYLKHSPGESLKLFEKLVAFHPRYLPTYYPFAQLLIAQQEGEKAEKIFEWGIQQARDAGAAKTLRELQSAYRDWQDNL